MDESRQRRINLIKQIEEKRNSKVIAYITSDRQNLAVSIASDIIPLLHEHILSFKDKEREKIDLFIYSRGGDSNVPWALVSMIREYCKKGSFSVLVPFRAHSAATVISLGADEVIMTKKGELGPIDATLSSGPYNPIDENTRMRLPVSVEDVTGYFSLLKRFGCERPDETMEGFRELTKKVHPLALGSVNRTLEETKLVGLRLLTTRAKPFSEEKNNDIIKKLSSELYSHSHAITRTEAVHFLGLDQVKEAESQGIDELMWALYCEYRELFDLNNPFVPEEYLIKNDIEANTWDDLKLACIESSEKLHICKQSLQVKKLRNIPPNITVSLNQMQFPQIIFPNLPNSITPQQQQVILDQAIRAQIQTSIDAAVVKSIDLMLESFPQKGFEKIAFNTGWVEGAI